MKVLFLDCGMGLAGDMLMGALYELLSEEQKQTFFHKMLSLSGYNIQMIPEKTAKCGVYGTHMKVLVKGQEECSHDRNSFSMSCDALKSDSISYPFASSEAVDHKEAKGHVHTHEGEVHAHAHTHTGEAHKHGGHHHTSMADIHRILSELPLEKSVAEHAISVYQLIAEAESICHNTTIEQIHFHEVGELDAIADVVGNAVLMELLQVDAVYATPVNVGFGKVKCAHGILPIPAPATAEILKDLPVYAGKFEGEMCTPTGAALYKHYVTQTMQMPAMTMEKIGIGCGTKDFPAANVVRAILGNMDTEFGHAVVNASSTGEQDRIVEITCNLDDMTGEELGFAMEVLLHAGALDVFFTPIYMKKNRPGYQLTVLCHKEEKESLISLIFRHTTTFGIRFCEKERCILPRTTETIRYEDETIRMKKSLLQNCSKAKPEYDDLAGIAIATGKSLSEVKEELRK